MNIEEAKLSATAMTQVDVFTEEPYTGNPADVCILDHARDDISMSRVAREMACPNTAFVQRRSDGDGLIFAGSRPAELRLTSAVMRRAQSERMVAGGHVDREAVREHDGLGAALA